MAVAARLPKRRLFKSVLACPSRSEIPESLRRYSGARCGSFIFIFLRTLLPSLCHPAPRRLAIRVAGRFGHFLAFGCVSQKFLRWVHVPSTLDISPVYQTPNSGNVPRPLQNEPRRGSLARPESPRFKPSGRKATTIIIVPPVLI